MNSLHRNCPTQLNPITGFNLMPTWFKISAVQISVAGLDSRSYEGKDANVAKSRGTKGD